MENHKKTISDYVSLVRGTTYNGALVGKPGVALLGLGSIQPGGGFREGNYKTYGGDCPAKLTLFPGDLYVALKGATKDGSMVGSVARVPATIKSGRLTQDTVKLQLNNFSIKYSSYLYWLLRTPQYRTYCAQRATGSAVAALSRDDFLNYPVPPLDALRLSFVQLFDSIEQKIENLRRQNETLEAIAQTLFKHWFIDFEFPNEDGKPYKSSGSAMIPSELGEIPEGWQVGTLGEIINNFDRKRIPLSSTERENKKGQYPYYGASSIMDYIDDYIFDGVFILMGEDGTVIDSKGFPILQYAYGKFWANNHTHVLQGKEPFSTNFIYLFLSKTKINNIVTGAVQPKINQGNMNSLELVKPHKNILNKFDNLIIPIFQKRVTNEQEIETLTKTRDTLLPKLMSGNLRVN